MKKNRTLWSQDGAPDAQMLAYTIADDRTVDARLLRWDIIGSLGHLEALAAGKIISAAERAEVRTALLAALKAFDSGKLSISEQHEDGHSAVEFWLTEHFGDTGERIHTGRSRNDQVATDLRLYLKDEVLTLHGLMCALAAVLLDFAKKHQHALWPGYTHQRVAMPSSAGLWAAGFAVGLIDAAESVAGFWPRLDRSPLGSAAGYGVPLPLDREAAAKALGFYGIDPVVTLTQNSRGKLESAVLFWCLQGAQECAKLSADVILYSADEFGWLTLPHAFSTGSSIMPQKRNPDLFELTRGRTALLQGDLQGLITLVGGLPGGYHRDFQLLKAPLMRGVDSTREMLAMLSSAVPHLGVNAKLGEAKLQGEVLATDEVMRRVRKGKTFRAVYREVAVEVKSGKKMPAISVKELAKARTSTGGIGNLQLPQLQQRLADARSWAAHERKRFSVAVATLTKSSQR